MKDHSPPLQIIGQLAREYDEKYRELEKLISETQPEIIPPQLRALAERATDRFRSAQVAMLSMPNYLTERNGKALYRPWRRYAALSMRCAYFSIFYLKTIRS